MAAYFPRGNFRFSKRYHFQFEGANTSFPLLKYRLTVVTPSDLECGLMIRDVQTLLKTYASP